MIIHKKFHLGIKGLIKDEKGKILLLLKSPNKSKKFGRKPAWDIPGGRIEEGDSIEKTLNREIEEETGIKKIMKEGLFYAVISNYEFKDINCGLILFIYECTPIGKFEIKLDDEHDKFGWFSKSEAVKRLKLKYPPDFIEQIKSKL